MGFLIWRVLVTPNYQCPLAAKRFRGTRMRSMSSIIMPNLVELGFHPPPGAIILFVRHAFLSVTLFLSITLFVTSRFWMPEFVRPTSPWRQWSEMILMPLDRGRFVVVHACSTFSDCRQLSTSLNAEVQKMAKIEYFCCQATIDRSRRILTCKCALWVSYSTLNLAVVGKRGSVQEPQKSKFAQNCGFRPPEADTVNSNTFR